MAHLHDTITGGHVHDDGSWAAGAVAPPAPALVVGAAAGATLAGITVTDASGGTAAHRVQVRQVGSSTWADATGETNPMPAGTLVFPASGLAAGLQHESRARAERAGLNSAYVGSDPWWQDVPVGGGGVLPGGPADVAAPVLTSGFVTGGTETASAGVTSDEAGTLFWRVNQSATPLTIPAVPGAMTGWTARAMTSGANAWSLAALAVGAGNYLHLCAQDDESTPNRRTTDLVLGPFTVAAPAPVAPSFTLQPISQAVVAGQAVTLTVAVAGTTPIAVQWRRGGVAITGATNLSYGFTAQLSDNGAVFDVVATNAVTSTASSAATLTVTDQALVRYEVFISDALAFAAHAPDPLIVKYAREAAIEFFQRTAAWKQRLPSIQSVAGQSVYQLPLPSVQCVIARMLGYWVDGREASLVDVHTGSFLSGEGDAMDAAWTTERATVHINPPPPAGRTLQFDVALKPSRSSVGLLEPLWEQYADALLSGLLARLLAVQNREWSNPQLAGVYAAKFKAEIDSVTIQAAKAFGKTRPRKNAVWF